MYQAIIVIHILLGLSIIGLILMQQGKGADAGATFGGGASGSVFGAQGAASFLSRTTAILAALFFVTSLGLAWINGNKTSLAVDFMSAPAVEKEAVDLGLPNVDGAINKETPPIATPENKSPTGASVTPAPVLEQQPAVTAPVSKPEPVLEKVDIPKAQDVKAVEEQEAELKSEKTQTSTPEKKK